LQHGYYYQLSVASTASAVSEIAVLHRRYAGVFAVLLVFALHMIKIWNHKNRNRTVNRGFFVKTDRNRPQIHKWKPSQHYTLMTIHRQN